jgi:hypothetical protein
MKTKRKAPTRQTSDALRRSAKAAGSRTTVIAERRSDLGVGDRRGRVTVYAAVEFDARP